MSAGLVPSLAVERVLGPVRFPNAPSAWAVVVLAAAVLLYVRWVYRREKQRIAAPSRALLVGLRVLAIALVALALFRPEREEAHVATDRSHLVVAIDTSASMSTVDRYRPADEERILAAAWPEGGSASRPPALRLSRGEIVARTLAGEGEPILRALAEKFVVHVYAFDEDLRLVGSTEPRSSDGGATEDAARRPSDAASIGAAIRALPAEGRQTAIGPALKGLAREFVARDDRRLAGVVLLSDGRDNAGGERPLDALSSLGKAAEDLRIAAVALGDPRLAKNLKVDRILAPDVVLVQDEVDFLAQLRQTGFDGVTGVAVSLEINQVAGADGRPFDKPRPPKMAREWSDRLTTTVNLLPSTEVTSARLRAPFEEAGTYDVTVRATLPGRLADEDAIVEDDTKVHRLRVVDATIKVLLVDREMRYETHFLKNVLVRESRHAGDPRRVDAQVWIQSFDPDVRQPSGKSVPPLRAFPSTRQELFAYDVIVFGDVAWRRLAATEEKSKEVLKVLRDFVAEGGGIAFVAGETANPTQYLDTALQDLVPLVMKHSDRANELRKTTPFRVAPTEFGREHPILSVLQDRPERVDAMWRDRDGWEWYWLYRARGGLKPGAIALARVGNRTSPEFLDERGEPYVVFAGMGYGKGRVFFSAIDQISRIRMSVADVYYGSFWDETIRWLATYRLLGGNKRYKIETDKESYFVGETAVIKVSALNADYKPLVGPALRGLQVEGPDGKPLLEAEAAKPDPEGGPGTFRTAVRLPSTGTYRIYVDPPERDGGARAEHRIEARFATREDQDKVPDHDALTSLVRASNPASETPRLWAPWQLRELVDGLKPRTTERVLDRKDIPLWDNPWPLILATLVLAIEWILRKRFQMI